MLLTTKGGQQTAVVEPCRIAMRSRKPWTCLQAMKAVGSEVWVLSPCSRGDGLFPAQAQRVSQGSGCRSVNALREYGNRLVVRKHPTGYPWQRKRLQRHYVQAEPRSETMHRSVIDKAHMGAIARLTPLLWGNQNHSSAGPEVGKICADEFMRFGFGHVFNHMRQEHCVERVACRISALLKVLRRESREAGADTRSNTGDVVIHTYAVAVEMRQVAADSAADVEYKARPHAPQIPSIRDLRIDDFAQSAATRRQPLQPSCVCGIAG